VTQSGRFHDPNLGLGPLSADPYFITILLITKAFHMVQMGHHLVS